MRRRRPAGSPTVFGDSFSQRERRKSPKTVGRALDVLVDIALAHPGLVALLLAPLTVGDPGAPELEVAGAAALAAFDVDPDAPVSERTVRVTGALTALAVLTLAAHAAQQTTATCFDALGHHRPVAVLPASDQVEA